MTLRQGSLISTAREECVLDEYTARENRQSTRVRRVQPVRFRAAGSTDMSARKTVSANVSRGGMLLVSRTDSFPPSGTWIDLVPQSSPGAVWDGGEITGRIVYTRPSPKNDLSFAGLEFLNELDERCARSFGLSSGEDTILSALKTLRELEVACLTGISPELATEEEISEGVEENAGRFPEDFESARAQFLMAAESFLRSWAERTVIENVVEHPDLSLRKGAEGLAALKSDLGRLLDAYAGMVEVKFDSAERWTHEADSTSGVRETQTYYDAQNENPAPWIAEALRSLMGAAGDLLVKHGYDICSRDGVWADGFGGSSTLSYRGRFTLPDELSAGLKTLSELSTEWSTIAAQSAQPEEARVRMEARRLWDES